MSDFSVSFLSSFSRSFHQQQQAHEAHFFFASPSPRGFIHSFRCSLTISLVHATSSTCSCCRGRGIHSGCCPVSSPARPVAYCNPDTVSFAPHPDGRKGNIADGPPSPRLSVDAAFSLVRKSCRFVLAILFVEPFPLHDGGVSH